MTSRLLSSILALSLALPPAVARAQDPSWPPAASTAHAEAQAAYVAGDYNAALVGYQRALAAMPDPILHRRGREAVLGSLRSTYARLYEVTHERAHLCAWRATLVGYTDALRSRGATIAETQGLDGLRAQVDADVARDFPGDPHCVPPGSERPAAATGLPVTSSPAPDSATPAPTTTPTPTRPPAVMTVPHPEPVAAQPAEATPNPQMFRAGGILLGVGIISMLGMGAGLIVADNRAQALVDLEKMTDAAGKITAADVERADQFRQQGRIANGAAIGAGVAGGVFLVTGIALMIAGRKARSNPTVAPTAGIWGLAVHGRF